MSLLLHYTVVVASKAQDAGMTLKYETCGQDGAGAAQHSHVTHFCNAANMINIADTGMQLTSTVIWLTAAVVQPYVA